MSISKESEQLNAFGQYKRDIFKKLSYDFLPGKVILDVGCGDGTDSEIFKSVYGMDVYGCDIYKNENIRSSEINFTEASVTKLPYPNEKFDYIFLHDVLHHIDEVNQSKSEHVKALNEVKRVVKTGGAIIVVEGNRFNPMFYPHMVKIRGHNHFRQSYFKKVILEVFPNAKFQFFEAHLYPKGTEKLFKLYELLMEMPFLEPFRAYNVAVVTV